MLYKNTEHYLDYLLYERNFSSHTIRAYKRDLLDFDLFISKNRKKDVNHILKKDIHQYLYYLSVKNLNKTSIARKLASLKSFFNFLLREGIIKNNFVKNIPSPKLDKRLPVFLNNDQISLLLNLPMSKDITNERNMLILEIFYSTGVRISELVKIKLDHINMRKNTIIVLGKGNKQRLVILGNFAKERLKNYISIREKKNSYLFEPLRKSSSKHISERYVFNIVKSYVKKITQNEKISPHSLRHTFATHLINNGANLLSVKELLGHSSLSSTQIYTHINIDKMKKTFRKAHPHAK